MKNNQHIILRSTVSPGTTRFLHTMLNKDKKNIKVTFYPERFIQGYAIEEFNDFPQIIGAVDKKAEKLKNFLNN